MRKKPKVEPKGLEEIIKAGNFSPEVEQKLRDINEDKKPEDRRPRGTGSAAPRKPSLGEL